MRFNNLSNFVFVIRQETTSHLNNLFFLDWEYEDREEHRGGTYHYQRVH